MRLWQVTRFCCLSGMCFDCRAIVTGGSRKRMVVVENVTQEAAVSVVRHWVQYGAEASEMPETENVVAPHCNQYRPLRIQCSPTRSGRPASCPVVMVVKRAARPNQAIGGDGRSRNSN